MIDRFPRFFRNSGTFGTIQIIVLAILLFFAIKRDTGSGLWVATVPLFVGSLSIGYPVRHWLIEHFNTVKTVMSIVAVSGIVIYFFFKPEKETSFIRITFCFLIGTYMGVYFWMLSDEDVQRI